ncbi:hypothetical protein SAMN02745866_03071 [Alteromonadaceae bacterium Bs31]|nr:hypothetical protein SAMN02745866_03071 [Alteromonadaceae bacterium Bs31]
MDLKIFRYAVSLTLIVVLSACETSTQHKNPYQDSFDAAGIRSILVVPGVNRSVNIYAPGTMLSVLPTVLADEGYYVFPVNTVKFVLEHEGLYEAADVHSMQTSKLASMFGANAVLYVTVEQWDTQYVVIDSTTGIELKFKLVTSSGEEIWNATKRVDKSSNENNNMETNSVLAQLLGSAISAAMERAFPDYRPLAEQAVQEVFILDNTRFPAGPYHPSKIVENKEAANVAASEREM